MWKLDLKMFQGAASQPSPFVVQLTSDESVFVKGGTGVYLAVCDDEAESLTAIAGLLEDWEAERQLPLPRRMFTSGVELLEAARRERFTLYLLDVIMPAVDGMAAARELRSFDGAADIVFLTSSPEFACESYRVQALDYLLKPVNRERLFRLLDELYLQEQRPREALILKTGATIVRVPFSRLAFVEVMGKRLYFNLTNGGVREVAGSLKEYEDVLLARPEFMRVHRSYIVNMLQAAEFSSGNIRTFSGKDIPVSRLLYPQLHKDYMALLFDQGGAVE